MVAVVLLIVSLFHLLAPQAAWYLHIGWKIRDAEPSDGYLAFLRVGGGIGCVVAVIMIVVGIVNAAHVANRDSISTSWLNGIRSKMTVQHVTSMSFGNGFPSDQQLSTKQMKVVIPIIGGDLAQARSLGSPQWVNSSDGQLDITFDDGTGISVYDIDGNGNIEIGPSEQDGPGSATYEFQDSALSTQIQALMANR